MEPWSNPNRNALGVRYDADRYGLDTQSALSRDQWDTYLSMFMPLENNLIRYATDWQAPVKAAAATEQYVDKAFDASAAAGERRRRAYGIKLNADEQGAVDRINNINESLTKVGAANTVREATEDRQKSIMGVPTV
jgi:hypothetical protein